MEDVKKMFVDDLIRETRETAEALNKVKAVDPEGDAPVPLLMRITFLTEELKLRGYSVITQTTYLIIKE